MKKWAKVKKKSGRKCDGALTPTGIKIYHAHAIKMFNTYTYRGNKPKSVWFNSIRNWWIGVHQSKVTGSFFIVDRRCKFMSWLVDVCKLFKKKSFK